MKRKRTPWGWIWRTSLCILILPLFLFMLLSVLMWVPSVQQWAVDKASGILYRQTGIEFSIDRVRLTPLIDLSLDGILAVDARKDTLLASRQLLLSVDMSSLLDSVVSVKSLSLSDVVVDTKDLIEDVSIAGYLGTLRLVSDRTLLFDNYTKIDRLILSDADITIVMPDSAKQKESETEEPFNWIFDARDVTMSDVSVTLLPLGLHICTGDLALKGVADIGRMCYHADSLCLVDGSVSIDGIFSASISELILNDAGMDSVFISAPRLFADLTNFSLDTEPCTSTPVTIELSADMNMVDMIVNAEGVVSAGNARLRLNGKYSINDEALEADVGIHNLRFNDFIALSEPLWFDGRVKASAKGFDPFSRETLIHVDSYIDRCSYGNAVIRSTSLNANVVNAVISGRLDTECAYSDSTIYAALGGAFEFSGGYLNGTEPALSLDADLRDIVFRNDSISLDLAGMFVDAATSRNGTMAEVGMPGLELAMTSSGHVFSLPPQFEKLVRMISEQTDSLEYDITGLRRSFPEMTLSLKVGNDCPLAALLDRYRLSFDNLALNVKMSPEKGIRLDGNLSDVGYDTLTLHSAKFSLDDDRQALNLLADFDFIAQHGLPSFQVSVDGSLTERFSKARVRFHSDVTDGVMSVKDISSDVNLLLDLFLESKALSAEGRLDLADFRYSDYIFGDRSVNFSLDPLEDGRYLARASTGNMPLSLVNSIIGNPDMELLGDIQANVSVEGTLDDMSFSGNVFPNGVKVLYKPYSVALELGRVPITLDNMLVRLDSIPVYGVDSTSFIVNGMVDLNAMSIDAVLSGDRFNPIALEGLDSIVAVSGSVVTGINARVSGPFQHLVIGGDFDILPETDVIYHIDRRNYIHARAGGSLRLDLAIDGEMSLNGRVNVNGGEIRYSVPYYPLEPFKISEDSYVQFNGDISKPELNITAIQPAKATVNNTGQISKVVDFTVGLKVMNGLDDLALEFLIDCPSDLTIQKELESFSQDERNRIAAALLATGMYISDTNSAMLESGYALSSMLQRGLNAIGTNRLGNFVDIDLGIGGSNRADGTTTTDYSIKLSKSFFSDRLRVTAGSRISDSRQSGGTSSGVESMIDNLSVDWLLKKDGATSLSIFHKRDFDNIIEGELDKDGIGVKSSWQWNDCRDEANPYLIDLDGSVSYRSNMQFGPDLTAVISKRNLLHADEILSARINGAYYWRTSNRVQGSVSANDSYQIGVDLGLTFPKIHLPLRKISISDYPGSTNYNFGFSHENVAGGYTLNKLSGGITWRCQTSPYFTHEFSPFSLSLVYTSKISEAFIDKASVYDNVFKSLFDDEYIPSVMYKLTYNNSSDKERKVATRFDLTLKESANLIGGIQALFGMDFNEKNKDFVFEDYNQFLKFNFELRNLFRLTQRSSLATRIQAGGVFSLGNSIIAPLSECFYSGGVSSIRAFPSRLVGPGDLHFEDSDSYFYHSGELKLECNAEYRFPLFWMLEGALFVDAGNVWDRYNPSDFISNEGLDNENTTDVDYFSTLFRGDRFLEQLAVGTGIGLRFVYQSIVIRLDWGIILHAPYDTGKSGYFNTPNLFKGGSRLNFAIGYPF